MLVMKKKKKKKNKKSKSEKGIMTIRFIKRMEKEY